LYTCADTSGLKNIIIAVKLINLTSYITRYFEPTTSTATHNALSKIFQKSHYNILQFLPTTTPWAI